MTTDKQPAAALDDPNEAGSVFRALADIVYACDDYTEIYQAICSAAVTVIDGCDHASLMVIDGPTMSTAAATDAIARRVDALEREVGEGPCIDAVQEEAAQLDRDITRESAWPGLRDRVVAETPVRSMAGFRLFVDDRKVGALNLFGDTPGGLSDSSVAVASVLAAFASMALVAASHQEQARTLREGLESNRAIGKAIGLMMAFHKVSDDEAFAILREASQDMNLKLSEVARQVVEHHNRRPPG